MAYNDPTTTDPNQAPWNVPPQQPRRAVNPAGQSTGQLPPSALQPFTGTGTSPAATTPAQSALNFGGPNTVTQNGQPVPPSQQATVQTGVGTVGPTGQVTGSGTSTTPFNATAYYGNTDPTSVQAYVTGMLAQRGDSSPSDISYWTQAILSRGGGPNGYWDNLISTNQGGDTGLASGLGTGVQTNPQDQALRDALVKQLEQEAGQSLTINPNTDPTIQMEAAPYAAEQQRAATTLEQQAAEAGGPNANLVAQNAMIQENAAQQSGGYASGLVANELTARRDQIQQALTSMQGLLTADQQNQLQLQLDQLNQAVSLQEAQQTASNQLQQAIYNNNYNLWYENRVNQGLPTS